jgi:hypothetical protein
LSHDREIIASQSDVRSAWQGAPFNLAILLRSVLRIWLDGEDPDLTRTQLLEMFVRCAYTDSFSGGHYGSQEKGQKTHGQIMVERGSSAVEGSLES